MDKQLNVHQARGVFDILGDTFNYIRVHFKSLSKYIGVYVMTPLLAGSILFSVSMGRFMTGVGDAEQMVASQSGLFGFFGWEFFAGFFFLIITYFMLIGVVYQHIYFAGEDEIPDDVSEFSNGMFSKLFRLVPMFLLVGFALSVLAFILMLTIVEITAWLTLIYLPLLFFVFIKILLFPIAFFIEDDGAFYSLVRSWELTDGYFWQTFGVYLVISIVFGILSQLLSTPLLLVTSIAGIGMGTENVVIETLYVASNALSFVFQVLFFAAQSIAIGLHYYNLKERKEGHSLGDQIADLEEGIA